MSHSIDDNAARPERGRAGLLKTAFVTVLIVLAGIGIIWLIFSTEPQATRKDGAREMAMLVDVETVKRGSYHPTITVMGQVVPAREVTLSARVSGQVISLNPSFNPGRRVGQGEPLLRIDPADYEAVLAQRQADFQQALAELELEKGQQSVARQEFELLGEEVSSVNEALVLRKPQLEQARASVAAARASLRQAELDLERTRVRAPFPAQVLDRQVATGSEVSAGSELGRLVATDEYWVDATVPLARLRWLNFSDSQGERGAPVSLHQQGVWRDDETRQGNLTQLVGELDGNARMARVLITVTDPLALDQAQGQPPLILGTIVEAKIQGRELDEVIRVRRDRIRRDDTVWVMADGKLAIRQPEIVFRDETYAYIGSGLESGEQVITSDLASVVSGARLRLEGDPQ
ncbi:efflux RND transporter periplasmic adaptor subunit [Marinobacter oulmenensis]|uniref:RND family efflux transporter MFP subunit n=1 Tax=Marinobacter oulmenensis TaxID=643747 RepID=A0A840UC65_9GAMM|nr:efflux RND transporter periplasmic adaptor subunit [Marinobacter oulmenensis]MBB5320301.1 RND family efflux transporter MFP subunit [Marinobacter oulmenensis]